MAVVLESEEWGAFSDIMALLGAGLCTVIGLLFSVAGKDQAMVFHGLLLLVTSGLAGIYLLERLVDKEKPRQEIGLAATR